MPLETISEDTEGKVAEIMTEELAAALYNSGRCTVVERNQLASVLREIGFQMTGAVDPNKAVEAGKILGAQYIVVCKITMAGIELSRAGLLGSLLSGSSNGVAGLIGAVGVLGASTTGLVKGKIALTYRIVDVQTGEIKMIGEAEGSERGNGAEMAIYGACKEASKNVLMDMVQNVRARIADISGETIYIDLGSDGGFRKGETLIIARETSPIEVNGKIVGMKEVDIGTAKITEVNDEYSVCKITAHTNVVKKGDIVKRIQKKK